VRSRFVFLAAAAAALRNADIVVLLVALVPKAVAEAVVAAVAFGSAAASGDGVVCDVAAVAVADVDAVCLAYGKKRTVELRLRSSSSQRGANVGSSHCWCQSMPVRPDH